MNPHYLGNLPLHTPDNRRKKIDAKQKLLDVLCRHTNGEMRFMGGWKSWLLLQYRVLRESIFFDEMRAAAGRDWESWKSWMGSSHIMKILMIWKIDRFFNLGGGLEFRSWIFICRIIRNDFQITLLCTRHSTAVSSPHW